MLLGPPGNDPQLGQQQRWVRGLATRGEPVRLAGRSRRNVVIDMVREGVDD